MAKKKNVEIAIRSSTAEYLKFFTEARQVEL